MGIVSGREVPAQADCAVDGLRHSLDSERLNGAFSPYFYLLFVSCPSELRWRRLRGRYPEQDRFHQADSHPVEQQINSLRDRAFAELDNDGSLQNLYFKVDAVLNEIRPGGLK